MAWPSAAVGGRKLLKLIAFWTRNFCAENEENHGRETPENRA